MDPYIVVLKFPNITGEKKTCHPLNNPTNPACKSSLAQVLKAEISLLHEFSGVSTGGPKEVMCEGHINDTHHVQLGTKEVLIANGLEDHAWDRSKKKNDDERRNEENKQPKR